MTGGARRSRALLAVVLAAVAAVGSASAAQGADLLQERIDQSLERAAAWLQSQQADDGGWHSAVYGQMRGGAGNTAHVAASLARLPRAIRLGRRASIDRGIDFLLRSRADDGFVQAPDASSDYPNYATALTLAALATRGGEGGQRVPQLRTYLIAAQQTERLPWESHDGNIGSWGLVGGDLGDPSSQRDGNLSATRLAIEALAASGGVPESTAELATRYVSRLQNPDGGFRFLRAADDPLNKAGVVAGDAAGDRAARSYGTATADGLCALVDCGASAGDAPVQAAIAWLNDHDDLGAVPGFVETDDPGGHSSAREGLRFYYYAALAGAMARIPDAPFAQRRDALAEHVMGLQRPDGSWANDFSSMREDDPLIATAWAIDALSRLRPRVPTVP